MDLFFKSLLLKTFPTDRKIQEPFRLRLNFKSGEEWLCWLDQLLTDICNDNWEALELRVETKVEEQALSTAIVQYRNVINSIQFLLGPPPFILDLMYGLICQYNKDNRIYTEIHIAN